MSIITAEGITKLYGEKNLYNSVSFGIEAGEKIGIIGVNGTGKSTLLKIISGEEEPDEGQVIKANNLKLAVLPQTPVFPEGASILECVMHLQEDMADGWNMEVRAKDMLTRFGFRDLNEKADKLSGGERKKLALAATLIIPSDVLILDEPTNHLDLSMIIWLEQELKRYRGTILLVTHDRYFLDEITNRILELDNGNLYSYESNYSGFLLAKDQRIEEEIVAEHKRQSFLRTELEWVRRGAQARSTKQKARLARFYEIQDQTPRDQRANEKVEMDSISTRMGKKTVEISHLTKGFGDRCLLSDFTYTTLRGDRIGIVGGNGCGKSTLLKMIAGVEAPDSGSIEIGETIKIGYLVQEMDEIEQAPQSQRVIDYIRDVAEYIETPTGKVTAAKLLERFLFEGPQQYTPLEKLSGGEKRRLMLLKVLMEAPNVLLLDEPTNDLDMATLTVFEDFLTSFDGIVIAVSHDRYLLDNMADRIWAFEEGGQVLRYDGGYTDYVKKAGKTTGADATGGRGAAAVSGKTSSGAAGNGIAGTSAVSGSGGGSESGASDASIGKASMATWKNRGEQKPKFTYKEQNEYETIDADIAKLEERIAAIEDETAQAATDFVKLSDLSKEKESLEQQLSEKMERWEYLMELAEKIENYNKG